MVQIKDVTGFLEQTAPLSLQESYDNAGLLTGDYSWEVKGILISLDSVEDVIQEAINKKCNLVIAHHPIVFSGLKKINGKNYVERTIIKAIKNDIAIYAIHTNLDNVSKGVNAEIARRLDLINTQILSSKRGLLKKIITYCPADKAEVIRSALFKAGAGHIGNYDECSFNVEGEGTFRPLAGSNAFVGEKGKRHSGNEIRVELIFESHKQADIIGTLKEVHPYEEVAFDIYQLENEWSETGSGMIGQLREPQDEMMFLQSLKEVMKAESIKYTSLLSKKIKTVAVCGGSGSFLLKNAISAGADVFITSDFKYHQFFDADKKIIIADIGHYESEQYTIELIFNLIKEKFSTFAVLKTELNTNPVHYM